tara:strand:+ start:54 stop:305 length:252 start_codon:yes stop_codon:yes gene_type:complete
MKAAIIVIAGIMATAGPVFAEEPEEIKYKIRYETPTDMEHQVLKEFKLYSEEGAKVYKNNYFNNPKMIIKKEEELKDSYRKTK